MYEGILDTLLHRVETLVKLVYWIGFGHGAVAAAIVLIVLFLLFGRKS